MESDHPPATAIEVEYPAITFIDGKAFVSYRAASAAHIPNMHHLWVCKIIYRFFRHGGFMQQGDSERSPLC